MVVKGSRYCCRMVLRTTKLHSARNLEHGFTLARDGHIWWSVNLRNTSVLILCVLYFTCAWYVTPKIQRSKESEEHEFHIDGTMRGEHLFYKLPYPPAWLQLAC